MSLASANFHAAEVDSESSDGELDHVLRHALHARQKGVVAIAAADASEFVSCASIFVR